MEPKPKEETAEAKRARIQQENFGISLKAGKAPAPSASAEGKKEEQKPEAASTTAKETDGGSGSSPDGEKTKDFSEEEPIPKETFKAREAEWKAKNEEERRLRVEAQNRLAAREAAEETAKALADKARNDELNTEEKAAYEESLAYIEQYDPKLKEAIEEFKKRFKSQHGIS